MKKVYYVCDYCGKESPTDNFKYCDNSGLDNKCFDICSDECNEKHITYVKSVIPRNEYEEYEEMFLYKS